MRRRFATGALMRASAALIVAGALVAGCATAGDGAGSEARLVEAPNPPGPVLFTDVQGYSISTMSYGPDPQHLADLFMPAEADRVFGNDTPLILYVHGGGWSKGSRRFSVPGPLIALTKKGWAVASIDYRLATESNRAPAQEQDVARALVWFKSNASSLGLDPETVVLAGHSAGGHLAALVGLSCNRNGGSLECASDLDEFIPADESSVRSPEVRGVITFGAVIDLESWTRTGSLASKAVANLIGCDRPPTCNSTLIDSQQPLKLLDPSDPPVYLYHAIDDEVVFWGSQAPVAVDALESNFGERSSEMVWFDSGTTGGHSPDYANAGAIARFVEMVRSRSK